MADFVVPVFAFVYHLRGSCPFCQMVTALSYWRVSQSHRFFPFTRMGFALFPQGLLVSWVAYWLLFSRYPLVYTLLGRGFLHIWTL